MWALAASTRPLPEPGAQWLIGRPRTGACRRMLCLYKNDAGCLCAHLQVMSSREVLARTADAGGAGARRSWGCRKTRTRRCWASSGGWTTRRAWTSSATTSSGSWTRAASSSCSAPGAPTWRPRCGARSPGRHVREGAATGGMRGRRAGGCARAPHAAAAAPDGAGGEAGARQPGPDRDHVTGLGCCFPAAARLGPLRLLRRAWARLRLG